MILQPVLKMPQTLVFLSRLLGWFNKWHCSLTKGIYFNKSKHQLLWFEKNHIQAKAQRHLKHVWPVGFSRRPSHCGELKETNGAICILKFWKQTLEAKSKTCSIETYMYWSNEKSIKIFSVEHGVTISESISFQCYFSFFFQSLMGIILIWL